MFGVCELLVLLISLLAVILSTKLTQEKPSPIFGIYQRPGHFYWLKVLIVYLALKFKKLRSPHVDYIQLEKEPVSEEAPIHSIYFNGSSSAGDCLVAGIAKNGNALLDGYGCIKLSNIGVLRFPKATTLELEEEQEDGKICFESGALKLTMTDPMRAWKINYDGKMKDADGNLRNVVLSTVWTSYFGCFNAETHGDEWLTAKAVALEEWNCDYFRVLKQLHQNYYEQPGELKGTVSVDGEIHELSLSTIRMRMFGAKRVLRSFHRYALHFINVANGDRITVGAISVPVALSRLHVGHIFSMDDRKAHPIENCDLELYQHGEDGAPPMDYAFTFKAGGKSYTVEAAVVDSPQFVLGKERELRVVDRICRYRVNGISGWGVSEWQYRNTEGK